MIYEVFVFGTFWFWLLAIAALIGLIWSIAEEAGGWASFVTIIFFAALALFGSFNVVSYAYHHPVHLLIVVGIYLLGGVPWASAKLWIWAKNLRDELEDIKADWLQEKGYNAKTLTAAQVEEWSKSSDRRAFAVSIGNTDGELTPKIRNHKSKVISWMVYWPVSLFWTLCNDALKRLWNSVYHAVSQKLQSILNTVFRDADLAVPGAAPSAPAAPPTMSK